VEFTPQLEAGQPPNQPAQIEGGTPPAQITAPTQKYKPYVMERDESVGRDVQRPAQRKQPVQVRTSKPPTSATETTPESRQTIGTQMSQLAAGKRRVVMVPKSKGGTPDITDKLPEGMAETTDNQGNKYIFNPQMISASDIQSASEANKLPEILGSATKGMGAPDKTALPPKPPVVVARDADGAEVQATATDVASLPKTVEATKDVKPEGGTVTVEPAEKVVKEREESTQVDKPSTQVEKSGVKTSPPPKAPSKTSEKPVRDKANAPVPEHIKNAAPEVQAAFERLRKLRSERGSPSIKEAEPSSDMEQLIPDLITIGKHYLSTGAANFGQWSNQMIADIGETVKPVLQRVWDQMSSAGQEQGSAQKTTNNDAVSNDPQFKKHVFLQNGAVVEKSSPLFTGKPIDNSPPQGSMFDETGTDEPLEKARAESRMRGESAPRTAPKQKRLSNKELAEENFKESLTDLGEINATQAQFVLKEMLRTKQAFVDPQTGNIRTQPGALSKANIRKLAIASAKTSRSSPPPKRK
jgi:hypothetical protein